MFFLIIFLLSFFGFSCQKSHASAASQETIATIMSRPVPPQAEPREAHRVGKGPKKQQIDKLLKELKENQDRAEGIKKQLRDLGHNIQ